MKSIKSQNVFGSYLVSNATLSILASKAGVLHSVNLGMLSCPTLTLYDNASGASGTVLALIEAGAATGNYVYDTNFLVGLSAWATQTGKVPMISVSARLT